MSNFNKVMLMGTLTRDIEVRSISSGTAVGQFGLAINRKYKAGNEWKEEATFVDCEAWGKQAETMAQYLGKGRQVFIEGRLKLDQWDDKSGQKRSKLKVVVEQFQFIGGKGDSQPKRESVPAITDEDIPF